MYGCYLIIKLTSMLYQRLAIYFLKAEYIIQVMNSAVKDKGSVG
jgi:hypothetical protein